MDSLAEALAVATAYIASRPSSDSDQEDQDVEVLETISAILQLGTEDEIKALGKSAAKLAFSEPNPIIQEHLTHLTAHLGLKIE